MSGSRVKRNEKIKLGWTVHTPNLINDIIANMNPEGLGVVRVPLEIFKSLLVLLGERAIKINDPELDMVMCRLTLYEEANPNSPFYIKDWRERLQKEIDSHSDKQGDITLMIEQMGKMKDQIETLEQEKAILKDNLSALEKRLDNGRDYLMECGASCNDSDCLVAFGWNSDGYPR